MYWFPVLVSLLLYSPGLISVVCCLVWVFVDCYAVVLLVASLNWHGVVFGAVCVSVCCICANDFDCCVVILIVL